MCQNNTSSKNKNTVSDVCVSSKEARQGRTYKLYVHDENTLVNNYYRFNCNMANPAPSEV